MAKPVRLRRRAASDLEDASEYYRRETGEQTALEFIDAVLQLKVRPHITADRSIIMKLEVSRNAPDDSIPTPTGSPAISKNEATTETLVKDGQTLVIGGIYVIEKSDRHTRVPILHKVPFVGAAPVEAGDIHPPTVAEGQLRQHLTSHAVEQPRHTAGKARRPGTLRQTLAALSRRGEVLQMFHDRCFSYRGFPRAATSDCAGPVGTGRLWG